MLGFVVWLVVMVLSLEVTGLILVVGLLVVGIVVNVLTDGLLVLWGDVL